MKRRLPQLIERTLREARSVRSQLIDKFERQHLIGKGAVTCLKGCTHCCYHPVVLSILEGIGLFRYLEENHIWSTDLKRTCQEAMDLTWDRALEVWLLSMIPCPLLNLETGLCRAYKGRPYLCRITASKGDPHYCHPHRINKRDTHLVERSEYLGQLNKLETQLLKQHKLPLDRVPLAAAILYGERILKEDIELADIPNEVLLDWIKRTRT